MPSAKGISGSMYVLTEPSQDGILQRNAMGTGG
jgi:hypothetical protein